MYQETEQLMSNYMDKIMKSRSLKKGKDVLQESGKVIRKDAPNIFISILKNILKAIFLMPLAIFVMPFVDAFRKRPSRKGMLDNFKRDVK